MNIENSEVRRFEASENELFERFKEAAKDLDSAVLYGLLEGTVDAFTDKAKAVKDILDTMPAKVRKWVV